jgi:SRSO17 transposase
MGSGHRLEHLLLVWNKNTAAVAAGHSVDVARGEEAFGEVIDRIAPRFARYEPLRHAASLMQGLLAPLERKNCWTIAEHRGHTSPHALQHLLGRARWDADGVRDDLRGYVVDHLGDPGAVLVIDETGDLKKGTASVGVQRQYTGTAGRIENAQVAVYLTYAAPRGHAFIDRALYLPKVWTEDPDRRTAAGVPAEVEFATKPALATAMIDRAVEAGVPAGWVAGDEVYGADPQLRAAVRGHGLGYVLQVASNRQVTLPSARKVRVDELPKLVPAKAWQRYSAGAGTKGPRWYSWAWVQLTPEPETASSVDAVGGADDTGEAVTGVHHVLIRRNRQHR